MLKNPTRAVHMGGHGGSGSAASTILRTCFTLCGLPRRQQFWTRDPAKVTCGRCLRLMAMAMAKEAEVPHA